MKDMEFGANLSVRRPRDKKTIVLLGHDECIFKQFQFTNKGWVSDKGVREILPKDEGLGVMISAFQCREFGFVNRKRECGLFG